MKILLTGGSGMVGHNLLDYAQQHFPQYQILAPSSTKLNLLDINKVRNFIYQEKPDLIIHAAGKVGGIQANITNPVYFLADNVQMGHNIIMASFEAGVKQFLNLGSSCMYPKNAKNPLNEQDILTASLEPTNEGYALAKIVSTRLCEYISNQYPEFYYKTLVPCNLYGKYDAFDGIRSHMIPAAIRKIHLAKEHQLEQVEIWGDGTVRREFMYAEDLARAVFFSIKNLHLLPNVVNVGLGLDYTVNEYYQAISDIIDYKGSFSHDLSKPVGMKQKLVDVQILSDLGWKPQFSLIEGLTRTYEYFKESQKC